MVMLRPGQVDQAKSARLADALRRAKEHGSPLVRTTFRCHPGEGFEHGREPVAVVDRMLARRSLPSVRFRALSITPKPVGPRQELSRNARTQSSPRSLLMARPCSPSSMASSSSPVAIEKAARVFSAANSTCCRRISRASDSADLTSAPAPGRSPLIWQRAEA